MLTRGSIVLAVAAFSLTIFTGCESQEFVSEQKIDFDVLASHNTIIEDEVVTFTTRSTNTAGHDTRIEWRTTGGKLEVKRDGDVARVRFDEPGRYVVTGTLVVDERPMRSDSIEVNVRPLR